MKVRRSVSIELEPGDFAHLQEQARVYTTTHYPTSKAGLRALVEKAFLHGTIAGAAKLAGAEDTQISYENTMAVFTDCRQCKELV